MKINLVTGIILFFIIMFAVSAGVVMAEMKLEKKANDLAFLAQIKEIIDSQTVT